MKTTVYYIGFFKYDDSELWQKTSLRLDKNELQEYLNNMAYINKNTVIIKEIELPN